MDIINQISSETGFNTRQVSSVVSLLEDGATVWFIARYRKEKTGSLDEVAIADIRDRMEKFKAFSDRKKAILKSLSERELLTSELEAAIEKAHNLSALEDLYEAYKPKKQTRATKARERGLEPLAAFIRAQTHAELWPEAKKYIDPDKDIPDMDAALAGAKDIIAEDISQDPDIRKAIRELFQSKALVSSVVKKSAKEEGTKFKDYFDWSEPASKAPSHRILAMFRGQKEGVLTVHVLPQEEQALKILGRFCMRHPSKTHGKTRDQMILAVKDGYKRLLSKSMEKEMMGELKARADKLAIEVFAGNLRDLLLSPPMGEKRVLAVDPGFRTGCKLACLDAQGKLLHHDLIYLHKPDKAKSKIVQLVKSYNMEAVAVGNGTAGRETQALVMEAFKDKGMDKTIDVAMTDESGASVYSASDSARSEFPDHDITVRGAVSIGRRLMDPLAELVKIDPKSIGVGQYQHDVDQGQLRASLDDVVKSCVNRVGVEVNTASSELLTQVSGLNKTIAANLVAFRNENGPFLSRRQLLKVPRLGPKAFEQAAGFLRIKQGKNPLDNSGIHPESYHIVDAIGQDLGWSVKTMIGKKDLDKTIDLKPYITAETGLPTLKDIIKELSAPGRDPRPSFQSFAFDDTVREIKDLVPGMVLPGIVTNVTAFGAFVDVGVHQDGLVHISQLADRFVKDPGEIVSVRQQVRVRVLEVDTARKRISLSMKQLGS
ncbi:MAG: RNA-binding transcriptional accessory protein [Desulfobacterales bacterium]|nr:RNA-binding transcriptional accessory protein [Desulfobacterales bacterium]